MQYVWDDRKNALNREKHGVDFERIHDADWRGALASHDTRKDYGEVRIAAYVPIHARLYVVIYVKRGNVRRIISLRKANARERSFYEKTQK